MLYYISEYIKYQERDEQGNIIIPQDQVVFDAPTLKDRTGDKTGVAKYPDFNIPFTITNGRIHYEAPITTLTFKVGNQSIDYKFLVPLVDNIPPFWKYFVTYKQGNFTFRPTNPSSYTYDVKEPHWRLNDIEITDPPNSVVLIDKYTTTESVSYTALFNEYSGDAPDFLEAEIERVPAGNSQYNEKIKRINRGRVLTLTPYEGAPADVFLYGDLEYSTSSLTPEKKIYNPWSPQTLYAPWPIESYPTGVFGQDISPLLQTPSNSLGEYQFWEWRCLGTYISITRTSLTVIGKPIDYWPTALVGKYNLAHLLTSFSDNLEPATVVSFRPPLVNGETILRYGTYPTGIPFSNKSDQGINLYDFNLDGNKDQWSTDANGVITFIPRSYNEFPNLFGVPKLYYRNALNITDTSEIDRLYHINNEIYTDVDCTIRLDQNNPQYFALADYLIFQTGYNIGLGFALNLTDQGRLGIYSGVWGAKLLNNIPENINDFFFFPFPDNNNSTLLDEITSNTSIAYKTPYGAQQKDPDFRVSDGTITTRKPGFWINIEKSQNPNPFFIPEEFYTYTFINGYVTNYTPVWSNFYTKLTSGIVTNNVLFSADPNTSDAPQFVVNSVGIYSKQITENISGEPTNGIGHYRWITDSSGVLTVDRVYRTELFETRTFEPYANNSNILSATQFFNYDGSKITSTLLRGLTSGIDQIQPNYYRWELDSNGLTAPVSLVYYINTLQSDPTSFADSNVISNIKKLYTTNGTLVKAPAGETKVGLISAQSELEYRYETTDQGSVSIERVYRITFDQTQLPGLLYSNNSNVFNPSVDTLTTKLYTFDGTLYKADNELRPFIIVYTYIKENEADRYYQFTTDVHGNTTITRIYQVQNNTYPVWPSNPQEIVPYYMNNEDEKYSTIWYTMDGDRLVGQGLSGDNYFEFTPWVGIYEISNSGATEYIRFNLTNINLMQQVVYQKTDSQGAVVYSSDDIIIVGSTIYDVDGNGVQAVGITTVGEYSYTWSSNSFGTVISVTVEP
jgi:hypothetical protein